MSNSFLNVSLERFKNKQNIERSKKRFYMTRALEILSVLILVVGILSFFYLNPSGDKTAVNTKLDEQYALCIKDIQNSWVFNDAIKTGDSTVCENIEGESERNECMKRASKDGSICERYKNASTKSYCLARNKNDVVLCDSKDITPDIQKICKTEVLGDESFCEGIVDDGIFIDCKISGRNLEDTESYCSDVAWSSVANTENSESFCDNIINEKLQSICFNNTRK